MANSGRNFFRDHCLRFLANEIVDIPARGIIPGSRCLPIRGHSRPESTYRLGVLESYFHFIPFQRRKFASRNLVYHTAQLYYRNCSHCSGIFIQSAMLHRSMQTLSFLKQSTSRVEIRRGRLTPVAFRNEANEERLMTFKVLNKLAARKQRFSTRSKFVVAVVEFLAERQPAMYASVTSSICTLTDERPPSSRGDSVSGLSVRSF